jgi:hypothetical protein
MEGLSLSVQNMAQRRFAPMATILTTRMHVRPMATTDPAGSPVASSLEPVPGTTVATTADIAEATTTADTTGGLAMAIGHSVADPGTGHSVAGLLFNAAR